MKPLRCHHSTTKFKPIVKIGTWPILKSNTPTSGSISEKTEGVPATASPPATEGDEAVDDSGSRLPFFQRLRSKSIPPSDSDDNQEQEQSSGAVKKAVPPGANSKTTKKKKKKSKK